MPHDTQLDLVYSFYQGLCRHLQIVVPITTGANNLIEIKAWCDAVDAGCEVHQLRTYVLTNEIAPEVLKSVLEDRFARKARAGGNDDKLDLLLVHFLAQSIPRCDTDVAIGDAVKVLEPVLGSVRPTPPPALVALGEELRKANHVGELLTRKLLQRVHQLRADYRNRSAESLALFAWFTLIVRRTCIRVVMADLDSIDTNCRLLRLGGVTDVQAGHAENNTGENLESIQAKCSGWRRPFAGKYDDDSWFREIAACKQITDEAVRNLTTAPAPGSLEQEQTAKQRGLEQEKTSSDALIHVITQKLQDVRSSDIARVQLEKAAIMLSSAEIRAFRSPDEPSSQLLRDMVLARANVAEARCSPDATTIERARAAAEEVLRTAQDAIAAAQNEGNSELSINLMSSARALEKAVGQLKAPE